MHIFRFTRQNIAFSVSRDLQSKVWCSIQLCMTAMKQLMRTHTCIFISKNKACMHVGNNLVPHDEFSGLANQ